MATKAQLKKIQDALKKEQSNLAEAKSNANATIKKAEAELVEVNKRIAAAAQIKRQEDVARMRKELEQRVEATQKKRDEEQAKKQSSVVQNTTASVVSATPNQGYVSQYSPAVQSKAVKTAPIDTVQTFEENDILLNSLVYVNLIWESLAGHELINIARGDIINGQSVIYQPIKNISQIAQQYNPTNILSLQSTSDKYFSNFSIKLDSKVPSVGNGPNGGNVYFDSLSGDIVVESINLESDEQIEFEIVLSGTIYESDLNGSES